MSVSVFIMLTVSQKDSKDLVKETNMNTYQTMDPSKPGKPQSTHSVTHCHSINHSIKPVGFYELVVTVQKKNQQIRKLLK